MNAVKIALLGTAALAAVSVSAYAKSTSADDLVVLKAQMEALNSRIAQLEATPSMPAGYQLLSVSQSDAIIIPGYDMTKDNLSFGKKATNIGIMPTADVPASTNIQWTGHVRAAIVYKSMDFDNPALIDTDSIDVRTRAGLKVVGTTDTAVGEVGVKVTLLASSNGSGFLNRGNHSVGTDGYWGWWKITPELTLGGGVDGTLANSNNAYDNRCTCMYTSTGGAIGTSQSDPSQIRLTYASGPISFAMAVEDGDNTASKSALGLAGEMKYSGDTFGFDVNAGFWDTTAAGVDSDWAINVGANMALGDIASLGLAVGVGEDGFIAGNSDQYTKASMFLGFTLSDAVSAELGATYTNNKSAFADQLVVGAGVYYTPVSQLTLGLEASYVDNKNVDERVTAALVTVYRF